MSDRTTRELAAKFRALDRRVQKQTPIATDMFIPNHSGNVKTPTADGQIANKAYVDASGGAPEGTSVLSTGETGGVKFLREDGDGTCSWQVPAGSGDMTKAVYDPTAVNGDAFDMANMVEAANAKVLTSAERTTISNQSGTNTGDQTSIVGITGTKAQFDTAVTDGNIQYVGDAPTAHTIASHSDTTATGAELETLTDGSTADSLHAHEGTAIKSTGELGGTKFLREDGDGTCSWQTIAGGGDLLAANNLSDVASAATSFSNIKQAASTTATGVVEIATAAEVDTGTDNVRAISPLALAGSALQTKVDGIETGADVTDTANVTAAGALMDSEVDADIKTLSLPANTTISAFGATVIDDADAAAARTTLGVDAAGTDNSTDVTLLGTPDYITISGQAITRNKLDISDDTNLVAGTNLTLSGANTLNVDDAFIVNNADDTSTGKITAANFAVTGDNATNDTTYVPMVLHGTDATPPTASTVPQGTIYIQYTA